MSRTHPSVVLVLGTALVAAGCGGELTTREKGALGGAAVGAAGGALIGAAVGSPGTGAAIGAGVGALGGVVVGGAMQEQERKAEAQPRYASAPQGAPPEFMAVQGSPVYYAPNLPDDYFYYGGQFYLFQGGTWYYAPSRRSSWVVVAVRDMPEPILLVPVEYYKKPPGHWKKKGPPPWAPAWGYRRKAGED